MREVRNHFRPRWACGALGILAAVTMPGQTGTREPEAPPAMVVKLSALPPDGAPAACVLGETVLTAQVTARAGAPVAWQFACHDRVVAQGRLETDRWGQAKLTVKLPSARVRTPCTLLMRQGEDEVRSPLVLLPPAPLAAARRRLSALRIGVIDPSGQVPSALAAEKVDFDDIEPDLKRDFFIGGLVVLAGFDEPALLADATGRFRTRVAGGMTLLVVNAPPGWSGLGFRVETDPTDRRGEVILDKTLADGILAGEDFGRRPPDERLSGPAGAEALAWFAFPGGTRRPVVLCRTLGRGRVCLVQAAPASRPADDALGRALIDRVILWAAGGTASGSGSPNRDSLRSGVPSPPSGAAETPANESEDAS